jgi:hypothetical protein
MITIQIGEEQRDLAEADENWINEQINRRRADGLSVCVKVTIREGDVNIVLSTPTCGGGGRGGRAPRGREIEVWQLWNKRGLGGTDFAGGNVVAVLKQLPRVL